MKAHPAFVILVSWAGLFLAPAAVAAQTLQISLPVSVGQKLKITVNDGRIVEGTVSELAPGSITLGGTRIPANDIQRVQERDSVGDGAGKGALILGLLGALVGIAGDSLADSLGGSSSNGSGFLAGTAVGLAAGAAIGAGFDAAHQKTIYKRRDAGVSVGLRPIVSSAGKGVGVQVRW
jgi:hypothetical protein